MTFKGELRHLRALAQRFQASRRLRAAFACPSSALVLLYHRVLPPAVAHELAVEPGMYVTPVTFGRHLDWLGQRFRFSPLGELVAMLESGERPEVPTCAITFDDGWRDNHDHAFPELNRRGIPATIFLVTERVGTDGVFWPDEVSRGFSRLPVSERRALLGSLGLEAGADGCDRLIRHLKSAGLAAREEALERLRSRAPAVSRMRELLDWSEIERMAQDGMRFESHGCSHPILTEIPREQAEREMADSLAALRARGHARDRIFAYPNGSYSPEIAEGARRAGYRAGVTTVAGRVTPSSVLMELPRISLHEDVSSTHSEFLYMLARRVDGR